MAPIPLFRTVVSSQHEMCVLDCKNVVVREKKG